MNNTRIYRQLGLSIKKINDNEIEIRHSLADGYFRGFFRMIFIGIALMISWVDLSHDKPPFAGIYQAVEEDFIWAFNPDKILLPMYKEHIEIRTDADFIRMFPNEKIDVYDDFKKPYIKRHFWDIIQAYLYFLWVAFILLLLFLPRCRGIRLNRKKRLIYLQNSRTTSVIPVPEQGDPLSGITYDRFGYYPFGQSGGLGVFGSAKYFSLKVTFAYDQSGKIIPGAFGVYPTPNVNHNLHIIKAMRAFFNEDNPEFLSYLKPHYQQFWSSYPGIFFCNFLAFPIRYKQKRLNKAIAKCQSEWQAMSADDKRLRMDSVRVLQAEINTQWKRADFKNAVNDDWDEVDTSPPTMTVKQNN